MLYTLVAGITAFSAILQHGVAREAGPTLMAIIPLLTVLGIMALRRPHGLHETFGETETAAETMIFLARLLSIQLLGLLVLRHQDYFTDFIFGTKTSAGSDALVCPGVTLSVMVQFFVNKGLVTAGIVEKFGSAYWAITALALIAQAMMVVLVLHLNRQHFALRKPGATMVPAQ